ncbi:DNA topoisomerase 2 [Massospora cicadina]|nr:DNA topoisomerase 2 [Massospora cicadina]
MTKIKVTIDPEQNLILVYNNGSGILVEIHKEEKVYVPELIFGHLLTSFNYDDSEKKVVGGRNGYRAKLCNIFSAKFIVETASKVSGKNLIGPPKITELGKGEEFTRITFRPDLSKFQMNYLNADIVGLLKRRVYDMCATVKGVSMFLNDNKLKLNNFKDYIHMYLKSTPGPDGEDLTKRLVFEQLSERWEVGFIPSSLGQLQQVSFVNSISTSKGGTYVNYVVDVIVKLIQEALDKKKLKSKILPGVIKSNMWIFVNCLIDNPSFDSQTKEYITLKPASFGSRCELTKKFQAGVLKGLCQGPANGSLTKVGWDYYSVFSLHGKLLNVWDANPAQIKGNKELINIYKIMGLNSKVDNLDTSKLQCGHLMIMMDYDHDGDGLHIKGLLINFFDYFYPLLLMVDDFMQEFITPIDDECQLINLTFNKKKADVCKE